VGFTACSQYKGKGKKGGVQRKEGRGNARKEWKVRKKGRNRLKEIKSEKM
jgi:hypothetical protein